MREGGGRGGIGEIIGRHVHSLDGGNGPLGGGGDSLLEGTEIGGQGGLVSHSGGDTSEKGGHLGTGLGESEDVIDEQQHISALVVSEVLGDGEASQTHTGSGSGGLVHLSVHQGGSGVLPGVSDDAVFDHFVVEIVAFSGPFADSGEHGVTSVISGDLVDQFHNKHGLADSGSAEESDLSSSGVGGEKVDNLDAGDQQLGTGTLFNEEGGLSMDGHHLFGGDGALVVDGLANDVHDAAESLGADGHHNGGAGVHDSLSSDETVSSVQGDGPDLGVSQVLGDLEHQSLVGVLHLEGVEDGGQFSFELHVYHGSNDLGNVALGG